jgi:hypothetical protein
MPGQDRALAQQRPDLVADEEAAVQPVELPGLATRRAAYRPGIEVEQRGVRGQPDPGGLPQPRARRWDQVIGQPRSG